MAKTNAPSFQFYPADWANDVKLSLCGHEAKGILIDLMCVFHQADPYGYLLVGGYPPSEVGGYPPSEVGGYPPSEVGGYPPSDLEVSRLLKCHVTLYRRSLKVLLQHGVLRKDENGIIYCKRMVKDEAFREVRRKAGELGGNPKLMNLDKVEVKVEDKVEVKVEVKVEDKVEDKVAGKSCTPPSSSSSSSSSSPSSSKRDIPVLSLLSSEHEGDLGTGEASSHPKTDAKKTHSPDMPSNIPVVRSRRGDAKTSEAHRIAALLRAGVFKVQPGFKPRTTLDQEAHEIDLMIRKDGRKPVEIEAVLRWARSDGHWNAIILNAEKLKKHFDAMQIKMRTPGKGQPILSSNPHSEYPPPIVVNTWPGGVSPEGEEN